MRLRFAPMLLALALAGCVSTGITPEAAQQLQAAHALRDAGRNDDARSAYNALASNPRSDAGQQAQLGLAVLAARAGRLDEARALVTALKRERLPTSELPYLEWVQASLAMQQQRVADAATLLRRATDQVPAPLRREWLVLSAEVARAGQDAIGEGTAKARLAALSGASERSALLRDAERALAAAPPDALRATALLAADDDPVLPLLIRAMARRGIAFERTLPGQPVSAQRPPRAADGFHPPAQVAVLLPLTGGLAAAGQAVRDGLLAGYFAETRRKPELRFHDTLGTPAGALAARDAAVREGADFLIGPLGREEVAALAANPAGPRWLVLNRHAGLPAGSAHFSLSPEDEGLYVARRLRSEQRERVVVLVESDEAAQRALNGLREELGATNLLAVITVDATGTPRDSALTAAGAHASSAQAIVLILRAPAARLLLPQLDALGLGALPRVATSQVLSGTSPRLDSELDGVAFPELPWQLGIGVGLGDADRLARQLPSARGPAARLFAFGFDAWRLTGYLEHLQNSASTLRGATGELGIDATGAVERQPAWAVFRAGQPQALGDGNPLPLPVRQDPATPDTTGVMPPAQ